MNAALWGKKKKQLFHKRLFRFLFQENPEKQARGKKSRLQRAVEILRQGEGLTFWVCSLAKRGLIRVTVCFLLVFWQQAMKERKEVLKLKSDAGSIKNGNRLLACTKVKRLFF